jgi:hypothetical protein
MNYKKDTLKFIADDATQAYLLVIGILITLMLIDKIDGDSFTSIFKYLSIGYFGQHVTNFKGIK